MSINYGFCDLCLNYIDDDKKTLRELLLKVYSSMFYYFYFLKFTDSLNVFFK